MGFSRKDSDFLSMGTRCAGWLYLPEGKERPPVVVMAHGFAAQRDFGLQAFAEKFADAGMAVFLFDYRNFGASDGEPRNLVSPTRHLADWQSAIAHVRRLREVDATRLALWGSSYSGGHVLSTASRMRGISAVVSQVPFVDGPWILTMFSPAYIARAVFEGVRDLARAASGRPPHCVPVIGEPDTFAMMNTPESMPGYSAIVPGDSDWRNECPARAGISLVFYRPGSRAGTIHCPVLLVCAERDSLIPPASVKKVAGKLREGRLISLPVGHFDVYNGPTFEFVVDEEVDFLREELKPE